MLVELHRRHERPRLEPAWILNPQAKIFVVVLCYAGCDRVTAHQMGEIRTESSLCWSAGYCVAIHAGSSFKNALPLGGGIIRLRGLALLPDPAVELSLRLNVHPQKHLGMLNAAVLRALSQIKPRLLWVNPHNVRVVGNQVRLAGQPRHPKAVVSVRGKQLDLRRGPNRHVQFIRGDNLQTWIAILPPELMAYHRDMNDIIRSSLLHVRDHPRRRHEQDHDDQDRNHRPCDLYLIASIDLCRLATVVISSLSELHNRVSQQTSHDNKNDSGDHKHKQLKAENGFSGSGSRRKDIGRTGEGWGLSKAGRCQKK